MRKQITLHAGLHHPLCAAQIAIDGPVMVLTCFSYSPKIG
jgi:hypothetical protein